MGTDQVVDVRQQLEQFVGEGRDERNVLGPLQNRAQFEIVADLVEKAKAGGGRVLLGGDPAEGQPGYFYPATLVADLDDDNPLVTHEQFGPALPIVKYSSVDDAVRTANRLDVGLGASVWGSAVGRHGRSVVVANTLAAGPEPG